MKAHRPVLDGAPVRVGAGTAAEAAPRSQTTGRAASKKMLMRAATVVQVLQDLFCVLLHVLFYL